jgi:hypothetical protein
VAPARLTERLGIGELARLRLEAPNLVHTVGLVVADREPTPPFVTALWAAAQTAAS